MALQDFKSEWGKRKSSVSYACGRALPYNACGFGKTDKKDVHNAHETLILFIYLFIFQLEDDSFLLDVMNTINSK